MEAKLYSYMWVTSERSLLIQYLDTAQPYIQPKYF